MTNADVHVIIQWVLAIICLLLVWIRVYVRLSDYVHRRWRELLIVLAGFTNLAYVIVSTVEWKMGIFQYYDGTYRKSQMPVSLLRKEFIIVFVSRFTWPVGIVACKALLLLIYHDFCPRRHFPKIFWLIVFSWVILIAGGIAMLLKFSAFMCYPKPTREFWSPLPDCRQSPTQYIGPIYLALTDILVFIIPIFIIFQLKNLDALQKLGAASMFAIGFLNVAMWGAFIGVSIISGSGDKYLSTPGWNFVIMILQIFQLPTVILVICIPQLRVLGRWKLARRVASGTLWSRSRSGSGNESAPKRAGTGLTEMGTVELEGGTHDGYRDDQEGPEVRRLTIEADSELEKFHPLARLPSSASSYVVPSRVIK